MASSDVTAPMSWTHRAYFRRFNLNVEQYGEILVADLFGGVKRGDAQPCFDVEASDRNVRSRLLAAGVPLTAVTTCFSGLSGTGVRIEVKSKLARTASGTATVIHCSDHKLAGVRHHEAATHLAVILFDEEGMAEKAWFFSSDVAQQLRRKDTKSKYIPVLALKNAAGVTANGIIDVCSLINGVASAALSGGSSGYVAQQALPADVAASRPRG